VFQTLLDECRISKLSKMEKESYEKSVLEYEEVQTAIEYAKELAAKASYKAGVKKGKEEGREEALLKTARNLLKLGISVSDVAKATGFSEEQITAMKF
ncbi:MAG: hypothetical protein J6W84_02740, partial [Bacteroidales bacterium]|nr:hypothetical protein [Bacteroidales bacterium]